MKLIQYLLLLSPLSQVAVADNLDTLLSDGNNLAVTTSQLASSAGVSGSFTSDVSTWMQSNVLNNKLITVGTVLLEFSF